MTNLPFVMPPLQAGEVLDYSQHAQHMAWDPHLAQQLAQQQQQLLLGMGGQHAEQAAEQAQHDLAAAAHMAHLGWVQQHGTEEDAAAAAQQYAAAAAASHAELQVRGCCSALEGCLGAGVLSRSVGWAGLQLFLLSRSTRVFGT